MKRSTKGAIAACRSRRPAAGWRDPLAYWTDSDPVAGDTFTAGSLSLTPLNDCDEWNLDTGEPEGQPFAPGTEFHRPGRRRHEDLHLHGRRGGHPPACDCCGHAPRRKLGRSSDVRAAHVGNSLTFGAAPVTEITEANDGQTLSVAVTVTFNSASTNTSQTDSAVLDAIDIVTSQVHSS